MPRDSRILILAPHPNDEVVACGIAALRARAAGVRLFVLYLTTGLPPSETRWRWERTAYSVHIQRRRAEARAAAFMLGLEQLGFRDTPARQLRFDLDAAAVDIARAVAACTPEALWVPAFEGGHQDHDTANALAASYAGQIPIWEFAAYHFAGGRVTTNAFIEATGREMPLKASAWEAARKRDALGRYASCRKRLGNVRADREVTRPLPAYDYAVPPHNGRLFRERYQWLPFRHPRVDFDPSGDIYHDIAEGALLPPPVFDDGPGEESGETDREFAGSLHEA